MRVSTTVPVYKEIVDFIASGVTPEDILRFHPSEEAQERVRALIAKEKTTGLTPEERVELDHYLYLEHIMRLAKARAREYLQTHS